MLTIMKNADFQRLEKVMQYKQIASYAEFSRLLNLKTPQIFTAIKSGKNKISRSLAVSIHDIYPDISTAWLLTGEGGMYITAGEDNHGDIHHNNVGGDLLGNGANKDNSSELTEIIASQQRTIERLTKIIEKLSDN